MAQSTPSWIIIPTTQEILANNGMVQVQIYTTYTAAQTAAMIAAIASGQDRTVYQASSYASASPQAAAITAQITNIPQV